jgi:hypothetical protein
MITNICLVILTSVGIQALDGCGFRGMPRLMRVHVRFVYPQDELPLRTTSLYVNTRGDIYDEYHDPVPISALPVLLRPNDIVAISAPTCHVSVGPMRGTKCIQSLLPVCYTLLRLIEEADPRRDTHIYIEAGNWMNWLRWKPVRD